MYNSYSKELLNLIPPVEGIDNDEIIRYLSKAFLFSFNENSRNEISIEEKKDIRNFLRKLINILENETIFNNQELEVVQSTSFFAAEALSLLLQLNETSDDTLDFEARIPTILYLQIETAMLYFISHNTINAVSILKQINLPKINESDSFSPLCFLNNLVNFLNGDLVEKRYSRPQMEKAHSTEELVRFTYIGFIYDLHIALEDYKSWFIGRNISGLKNSQALFEKIISTLGNTNNILFKEIYHLTYILSTVILSSQQLSSYNKLSKFNFTDNSFQINYIDYLNTRALGSTRIKARPFLWPPAISYIDSVFTKNVNSVISIPTGSGKSFLAEISAIEALSRGWVLYLAPTNALCSQIYYDLKNSLIPFSDVEVKRFLGYSEYSGEQNDFLELKAEKFVAVMTPEKCSLALRLYPDAFEKCSLCVFDEFHLINEKERGLNSDIVLSFLVQSSPNIRFVLMSAMISNPEFLSDWLTKITNSDTENFTLKWKPTRSLRGLLIIDENSLEKEFSIAKSEADSLNGRRINKKFNVDLGLLAGLSGPWSNVESDYKLVKIRSTFLSNANKNEINPQFPSWKNTSATQLASELSDSVSTICFILTQKHHVFSSAKNIMSNRQPNIVFEELVKAYQVISEAELGVQSEVFNYLNKGISVHSSSMLASEQLASEYCFKNGISNLMFATPTLAQGLNMPSVAVVIAGSSIGDPRDTDVDFYQDKVNSLILNCFGRGGRAGFANQGIAILVTDKPYSANFSNNINGAAAIRSYPVLSEQDASILIKSPLEQYIDNILSDNYDLKSDINELALNCMLSEYKRKGISVQRILGKTLGGYSKHNNLTDNEYQKINAVIDAAGDLAEKSDTPEAWYSSAAMKSGSSIDKIANMWEALKMISPNYTDTTISSSLKILIDTLSRMSPLYINAYFADDEQRTQTVFTNFRDLSNRRKNDTKEWYSAWQKLYELVNLYIQGEEYISIASLLFNIQPANIRTGRSTGANHIPSIFKFIDKVIYQLAIDAGCLIAIIEHNEEEIDKELLQLPTAIRYGCNSISCLSWFQYGYRQRICAHTLSSIFPVPDGLQNEYEWVVNKREEWLASEIEDENELLNAIKIIIKNS
ncbi:DEAD/DEAH box helicase [Flammeovirga aprica]|uniref:DEAD/DEAH box helicase n=1 Tax=Flammeovirga aprica JL-4 TaxID=694437 RepID=A0A7X9P269_9BACT|nr:DEAD/DEAH box helicase [Flammeovirga aprica]NME68198.1 DEAD/DEAH box helicase [Flammeovirga aprica JL-4]